VDACCLSWRLLCICGNPVKSLLSICSENPQGFPEFYRCFYASPVISPSSMSMLFRHPSITSLADFIIIFSTILEQSLPVRTSCPKDRVYSKVCNSFGHWRMLYLWFTKSGLVGLVDKMTSICSVTIQTVQWNMLTHFTHRVHLCINGHFKSSCYFGHRWLNIEYKSYVFWTVHNCNSWIIKDQLDVTCYFISLLMCSTCFGH